MEYALQDRSVHELHATNVYEGRVSNYAEVVASQMKLEVKHLTEDEVEWLKLVHDAIELCGKEVAPGQWGTEHATTSTIASDLRRIQPPHEHLQPVWRPTSSAPLWVCKKHAAHYRTRAAGNDEARDKV